MDWKISLSNKADKFLKRHHLPDEFAVDLVTKGVRKLQGETIAVDLRKLTGKWVGHYRVRAGKNRAIFSVNFEKHFAYVEVLDNRDSAYR